MLLCIISAQLCYGLICLQYMVQGESWAIHAFREETFFLNPYKQKHPENRDRLGSLLTDWSGKRQPLLGPGNCNREGWEREVSPDLRITAF
ncbi:hypothetical protein AMECASPLE_029530 [Ameca splendens]|uniref:Uncharacterized protein n=1 Tax=Ameca splendens TaxID=208324 RepID=A0ABV0XUR0_9TELE